MVKTTVRTLHHDLAKYLDLAHEGQPIIITKRGKPWAKLEPIPPPDAPRKIVWPDVVERTRKIFKGRKVEGVKEFLKMREEERW